MSKLTVTDFSKRKGSPFNTRSPELSESSIIIEQDLQKNPHAKQKERQAELQEKVNKKTAEIQTNKPKDGFFTEVVTHGAFTTKNQITPVKNVSPKNILGFPSSANDLALDAKTDLESDPHISKEVKEKVIAKLFGLVSIAQHIYESKVRLASEFEKFKDVHLKNEARREREHSEQLYKLSLMFQTETVQAIQRLKSELDISRSVALNLDRNGSDVEFSTNGVTNNDGIANASEKFLVQTPLSFESTDNLG